MGRASATDKPIREARRRYKSNECDVLHCFVVNSAQNRIIDNIRSDQGISLIKLLVPSVVLSRNHQFDEIKSKHVKCMTKDDEHSFKNGVISAILKLSHNRLLQQLVRFQIQNVITLLSEKRLGLRPQPQKLMMTKRHVMRW